ncbi:MAG: hypothetical protein HWD61_11275 [Parachlamydiaceae bacterium]|nr:MAG: hypothetical protein HWD61_11275 [Parachlamydiaceae bacterium]
MKIEIHNNNIELTPQDIKKLKPKFGLNGRRFDLQIDAEKWIKNISLNNLISAVKKRKKTR